MVQNGRGTLEIAPDTIAQAEFSHGFRGYDASEVRSFLRQVSGEVERLREAVAAAETRAAEAEAERAAAAPSFGDEATRVLQAAEEGAAEIRSRAEEAVAKMLRDAQDEATAERSRARQERADIVAAAEVDAASMRSTAQKELEDAREEGRSMVEEAREIRERVLANLSEKRQQARRELAQLRAGIEELRRAYGTIEELLAASVGEIDHAIPNARSAAMRAGEAVSLEPEPYVPPGMDRPELEDSGQFQSSIGVADTIAAPSAATAEDDEPVEATDVDEAVAAADVDEIDEAHEIEAINGEAAQAETDGDEVDAADAEVPAEIDLSDAVPDWVTEDRSGAGSSGASSESPDEEADDTEGTVIDLEARRTVEASADPGAMEDDDEELDELDPELPSGDAIDERRQAERRQLFEEQADAGETVLEFTPVMEEFGPADDPVPLVPPRERGDIDELFARIRESRADAVAQAREVLHRTSEMPVVQIGSTTPTADSPTADASSQDRLAHRDAVLEEFTPEVALSLKRSLADQLNEVLDVLRRSPEGITDVEQLVPDGADRTFGESVRELLGQAAVRATGGSSIDIGPVVRAVGGEIGGSLRGRISSHLGDPDQLERRIRSIYREWRRDRVDDVASDAVAAAYGLGLLGSLPDGTAVRWVIPEDGCCGADCYDNSLATDVVAGEPFPTGDLMAPARPGCRGLVVPADQ